MASNNQSASLMEADGTNACNAQQHMQTVLVIWLDRNAEDDNDDCRNTVTELRRAVNVVNICIDGEECIQLIRSIEDGKVCVVVSGSLGRHIVPHLHDMPQVDSIFVFCGNKTYHEHWAKEWPKIRGVFTEIAPICEALRQTDQQCEDNPTPMSFLTPIDATVNRLDPSFMYTQILKEIFLTIDFNDQHRREFIDYCRDTFRDNPAELAHVEKLNQQYHEKTPIWWYSYHFFLYSMLNRALRTMDGDIMTRMGFFINDLHRQITREHQKQNAERTPSATFSLYRGQGLSKADFDQTTMTNGGLIAFNCFLSASKRRDMSLLIAESAANNPDTVGVLFEMKIDPSQSTTPFASIGDLSAIDDEDEVILDMNSVFRVRDVQAIGGNSRLYEVHLLSTNDRDPQLDALASRIREESSPDSVGWRGLAKVLRRMGQWNKAEEIYRTLLDEETNESDKAPLYSQLALIKYDQGDYEAAIDFHQKDLAILQELLPPMHPDLAMSYNYIGDAYYSMSDYPKALASYEKALEIDQKSFPPTHPSLAASYGNIASVYFSMPDYSKALSYYEKAQAIQHQSLPPTHPDLAASYNNIGNVYSKMSDYPKALSYYEKALKIRQQSLPPTHPDLARSYNNIGLVYESMGAFSQACSFLERAVTIAEKSLPSDHPELQDYRRTLAHVQSKR